MCDCSSISWWLATWRALHFLACMLPVGLLAFHFFVAAPVFGSGSAPSRATTTWVLGSLLVALASGIGWLLMLAAGMGGVSPSEALHGEVVKAVLNQTQFGTAWRLRAVFWLAAFAASILMLVRKRPSTNPARVCLVAATALLGALAWAGHGVEGEGVAAHFHLAADTVHLIAAGVWPFGLAPFAVAIFTLQNAASPSRWTVAAALTRRFSAVALSCVAMLTLTGLVNSGFMLPSVRSLWRTDYGRVLLLKLAIFAVAIAVAAINRLALQPRLAAGHDAMATVAALRRNVLIEFVLGTAIILIVGLLGLLPPAIL